MHSYYTHEEPSPPAPLTGEEQYQNDMIGMALFGLLIIGAFLMLVLDPPKDSRK
jgi:hypothetical protein